MPTKIEVTRREIYDLVWSMPIGKAAASFPMSHLSLTKLCQKHGIPVPPHGHWKKSKENQERDRPPLPHAQLGKERFWVKRFMQRRGPNFRTLEESKRSIAAMLPVANGEASYQHECTRRTAGALKTCSPGLRGELSVIGDGLASINVPPETVPRALRVLDSLLLRAEAAGYSISSRDGPSTMVVAGVRVPFSIIERFVRLSEPPDQAEVERRASYNSTHPTFCRMMEATSGWHHRPTGHLEIVLGEGIGGGQRSWADRASLPLEERLDDVVADAAVHAKAIGFRASRIDQRNADHRAAESERFLRGKRLTLLREHADMLEEAVKLERLAERFRETDGGALARLPAILTWMDAYVAALRENCSAGAFDRTAGEWGAW